MGTSFAIGLPLLVMMITDIFLGWHPLFFLTWGSFFAVSLLGFYLRKNPKASGIFLGTLGGSVLFFIVTNLGVFLFQGMYPKDFSGLVECFVMAIPFFRNSLLGDLFYSAVFFGAFALFRSFSRRASFSGS